MALEPPPARQPVLNVPGVVIVLIALLALAHVARILAPGAVSERILNDYALDPAVYGAAGAPLFAWLVPPVSHMFLHANFTHLALNCLWLLVFGPVVARRFGAFAFAAFFLLCGLAGAAAYVAADWGQDVGAIGASGAISGLTAAAIRMLRLRGLDLNAAPSGLMPLLSGQVLLFSAVWMAANVVIAALGVGTFGGTEAIAWQAHLGGYLAGLLLAGPFDRFVGEEARLRRGPA